MKMDVRVTEILSRVVTVDTLSLEDAIIAVENMYRKEEIVLDYFDLKSEVIIEKKEENFMSKKDLLINEILQYLMKDEQKYYEESAEPNNHIYLTLLELQKQI